MAKSGAKGKASLNWKSANPPVSQKLGAFVEMMRPMEWSKPLLNMTFALLIAFYVYNAQVGTLLFVAGFVSVIVLWSGLYSLNNYTDWRIDALHPVKKKRAIPSGKISPTEGLYFSIALIVLSYIIALIIGNPLLVICLTVMLANQYLYTMEPFRFKSRKVLDIISGSMVNPVFRYLSGLVLFVPIAALFSQVTPLFPLVLAWGVQTGGYTLYRLFSKPHDKKVKMKSTIALMPEKYVKLYSYSVLALAVLSYFGLFGNFLLGKIKALGFLPAQYLLALLVLPLALFLLRDAIFRPKSADMEHSYNVLYVMTPLFALANIAIFIFLR